MLMEKKRNCSIEQLALNNSIETFPELYTGNGKTYH